MTNAEKARQLIAEGKTDAEICKLVPLTAQRINQIRYAKNSPRGKEDFYIHPVEGEIRTAILERDHFACQIGVACIAEFKSRNSFQFISFNPLYDTDEMMTGCNECIHHLKVIANRRTAQMYQCDTCQKEINGRYVRRLSRKKARCFECVEKIKKERKTFWCYKLRLNECSVCHTSERKHSQKGMCLRCLSRWRYHNDETYRAHHHDYYKRRASKKEKPIWNTTFNLTGCRTCYRTDRPHGSQGFCVNCWNNIRNLIKRYEQKGKK